MTVAGKCSGWRLFALAAGAVLFASVPGCGGSGGSSSSSTTAPYTQNVAPITVDSGPVNNDVNVGFVSVTICQPGTSNCQTIDHIDVDTGSSGLRLLSSVLSPTLNLTQQTDASGNAMVECLTFADGYVWGSVKTTDLTIAGEQAKSLPVQIIGDPNFANSVPADCSNSGPAENTVSTFGANGIIGIGNFQADCGSVCATQAIPGTYYGCSLSGCFSEAVATTAQVQNPVGLFAADNNGSLIQMASVPAGGAATTSGSLIFGIGTQTNNALGGATVMNIDPNTGYVTAVISNNSYPDSYLDTGSSAFFLPQSFAQVCTSSQSGGYFCPSSTLSFSVIVQGTNGVSAAASFSVTNADTLFDTQPTYAAFDNLAAINSDSTSIDLGLPFFFGRSVYTAIEDKTTPGGTGPYVAF